MQAIVLNETEDGDATDSSVDDNPRVIAELEAIPVTVLPWLADGFDVDRAAARVESSGLVDSLLAAAGHPTTIV